MAFATLVTGLTISVDYHQEFTASRLNATNFTTDNGRTGISLVQSATDQITITFNGSISAANQLNYNGSAAGFLHPDSTNVF